ncbi:MAG: response regulator transcription factor [Pseudomonadota bacterium]
MNILLVEDESRIADFIQRGLRAEGWSVTRAPDAETGIRLCEDGHFDAIILDLMLPRLQGREMCTMLRARKDFTPILMLSALDALDERVDGLRAGADDYMTKPFEFDELIARVEALARRNGAYADGQTETSTLRVGAIAFDTASLEVTVAEQAVELTARERDLLKLFLSSHGRIVSRERILSSVWGVSEDPLTNVVDVYIGRLRRKLADEGARLLTVRGAGWRLRID